MKIIHTSDLHIGLRLKNYDLKEEQEDILKQMVEAVKQHSPDVFIIAGDVYDKSVPSADAIHIFDEFITSLRAADSNMAIMIISGNHDSKERIQCYGRILNNQKIYVAGTTPSSQEEYIDKVQLEDEFGKVNFYLVPFIKPANVRNLFEEEITSYEEAFSKMLSRENIDYSERNVLISHQFFINGSEEIERMSSEIITVGNIDSISVQKIVDFDYVALGHIHKPMKVKENYIRYCGTPYPYSIDEAGQKKGLLLIDIKEKGEVKISDIPLKPLRNVRKIEGYIKDLVKEKSDDYVSVTILDEEDIDTIDMQVKIKANYPRLCEIKRKNLYSAVYKDYETDFDEEVKNPYEMFCDFYKDITEDEKEIMQDVINCVLGED